MRMGSPTAAIRNSAASAVAMERGKRSRMGVFFGLTALVLGLALPAPSRAAQLLIFERPGCPYCAAFDREVAPIYPLTAEGKTVPARRVDITKAIPADLAFVKVERLTPVFVLIDNGREIGRFRGYSGDDQFWGLFGVLLDRLKNQTAPAGLLPAAPVGR
jgi:thioredoxin-related protein